MRAAITLLVGLAITSPGSAGARLAGLELVVLGSGGPRAFGRGGTSYLVLADGAPRILVDAGPGAFVQIGKLGIDLARVDVVLLTHLHIDHSADVPAIFLARALTSDARIVFEVFGPEGGTGFPSTTGFLRALFEPGGAFAYQKSFGAEEEIRGHDLSTRLEAPEREIFADGDLRIRAVATHHGDCPSVAYRVELRGQSVTFAGDMDASALPNLVGLAAATDLLVLHTAVLDRPGSPEQLYELHTAPRRLGEAAREARPRRLLLGHLAPAVERRRRELLRSIGSAFKGEVQLAADGMRVRVRR